MTYYTLTLEVLTPVHVGTGEDLDALNYVLQKQDKDAYIFLVDSGRWFADHAQEPDVARALKNYNYLELRRILSRARDISSYATAKIPVAAQELVDFYSQAMQGKRNENELRINLLPRNPVGDYAYVPGSSIKGAIRTAIGSFLAHTVTAEAERKCSFNERKQKECFDSYNKIIFGDVRFDVFKHLKISDAVVPEDGAEIVRPVEVGKNPNKRSVPKGYVEALKCLCAGHDLRLKARLSIGDFADQKDAKCKRKIPSFGLNELLLALNQFYRARFEEEITKFYNLPHLRQVGAGLKPVMERIKQIKNNQALMRIGHFCHVESMTWDKVRKPKGKKIGNRYVYGTTRTLAEASYPFGWVLLTFDEGYSPDEHIPSFAMPVTASVKEHSKADEPDQDLQEPEVNQSREKLKSLQQRLEALPANQRAGSLPNIVHEVMADEDTEFQNQARQVIVEFVQKTGLKKSVKKKKWYHELVNG
ncbi:type III-A CRISPR-associated RAMP protein Csm5 [Desulfohalobiaceae bacterium Ax17]|uniref:type III-A CRISPR-associated RAMP protein Csm5 n=1 Tax=Desulfovulcanus ferrireducens TaxID=2831190 RepID=UPI00207B9CE2|nr:type III-A CRISPR-associated RAMP protein Csm5 [Desulfovulcanus ferrireducens]MBT8763260.1 type III-A CRISPR-associated RAMP protein Csm5 [Desulfovulcanus ferrireducens]